MCLLPLACLLKAVPARDIRQAGQIPRGILCSQCELCWHLHQIYFDRIEEPEKSPLFGYNRLGRLAILMCRLLSQGFLTRAAAVRAPHHPLLNSQRPRGLALVFPFPAFRIPP